MLFTNPQLKLRVDYDFVVNAPIKNRF
jgi:hypothetical protein